MEIWMYFYAAMVCFVVHIGNLLAPAFNKSNMMKDPETGRSVYVVRDKDFQVHVVPLKIGIVFSMYLLIVSVCSMALSVLMFFYAEHWWHALIVFGVTSFVILPIYNLLPKLKLYSFFYYVEFIGSPFLIFFTNYYLCIAK